MQPGDVLLAFSDGLLESHDEHGEQLEVPGLLALVRDAREAGAEQGRDRPPDVGAGALSRRGLGA